MVEEQDTRLDYEFFSIREGHIWRDVLSCVEIFMILDWLEKNDWNQTKTADSLGITRATLTKKIEQYDIKIPKKVE